MTPPTEKVVACADDLRSVLVSHVWPLAIWFLSINAVLWLLGELFHAGWIQVFGIAGFALFCVLPRILRMNRSITRIPCPGCGRPVGDSFTKNSRLHLRCKHCGEVSATDCGIAISGGIPYKITW